MKREPIKIRKARKKKEKTVERDQEREREEETEKETLTENVKKVRERGEKPMRKGNKQKE